MFKNFLRYLEGTVRIRVRGAAIERFLNLCSRHDIALHGIERAALDELHATVLLGDFKRLRALMGRTGCRVHLLRRRGAPFMAHRFRKRYMLFGGAAALAGLCWVLTSFLWVVHLTVPDGVSGYDLAHNLHDLGVRPGAYIGSIDARAVRSEMMYRMPELAFISINLHGNRLEVEAHARRPKPEMVDKDLPTSVYATKPGLITKMAVTEGTPAVKVGETVAQGDMLVSSVKLPTGEQGAARKSHATAEVEARTWYTATSRRAPAAAAKQYTGKETVQYALVFGRRRVNLFLGSGVSEENCDKAVEERKIVIADSLEVPVKLQKQTFRYYETREAAPDPDAVRAGMEQAAVRRLQAQIDGTITARSTAFRELPGGGYELTLYAECLEQIGREAVDTQELPAPAQPGEEGAP
ncbi:sporulation protein YqfD [Intestinibacillus massiliensis]|uniref:sporulation protein YqfD n=1 Tax=Intestinibacillus massiliensis TaxID=1871029 RepID=UPI000B364770|nr:sporulation protein YqfD [Intestinibacillus massiliensis]